MFEGFFVAIREELVPIVRIIILIALGKLHNIENPALEVQFQFLEFDVEFTPGLILNIIVELVAFDHFLLVFDDDFIKYPFDIFFFLLSFFRRVFRLVSSLVWLGFRLDWLIIVEECKYFRHVINIDSPEEGAIVVLKFLLPFLNELLTSISK